jgi:hypothetical protein
VSDAPPNPLDYAPPRPEYRRWAKRLVMIGVLLVLVAAVRKYGPGVLSHLQIMALQRDCLRHNPGPAWDGSAARPGPVPAYWNDLYSALNPPGFRSHGTVFLGRLRRPDGVERLVGIDLWFTRVARPGGEATRNIDIVARAIPIRSWASPSPPAPSFSTSQVSWGMPYKPGDAHVIPGRRAADDPAKAQFEVDGYTFIAWLTDDDRIKLRMVEPVRPTTPDEQPSH